MDIALANFLLEGAMKTREDEETKGWKEACWKEHTKEEVGPDKYVHQNLKEVNEFSLSLMACLYLFLVLKLLFFSYFKWT